VMAFVDNVREEGVLEETGFLFEEVGRERVVFVLLVEEIL